MKSDVDARDAGRPLLEPDSGAGKPDARGAARRMATAPVVRTREHRVNMRVYRWVRLAVGALFKVFVGLRVRGRHNVPKAGPLLLVANHLTYLEPPLIGVVLPRRLTFLTRHDVFDVAWVGRFSRAVGMLPVSPSGPRNLDGIRLALQLLDRGEVVGIFPEGARSLTPGLLRANPGVALLAVRSGAPILPVAVTGTEQLDSVAHFLFARPRGVRVRVVIGEPFRPSVPKGKLDHQALADQIMVELAKLLPPAYRGAYADAVAIEDSRLQNPD